MASRFRIYDNGASTVDRYTIVDSRPLDDRGYRSYGGFSSNPYHPQGFGQHGEIGSSDWSNISVIRFRNLGKRISVSDLPTDQAKQFAIQFMRESGASEKQINDLGGYLAST